jgi:hypothetical protein
MPVESGRQTIGTAATAIDTTSNQPWQLVIHNDDNTADMYVGGPAVGTATGLSVNKLENVQLTLAPGDQVYAVSSSGSHTISWLKITNHNF